MAKRPLRRRPRPTSFWVTVANMDKDRGRDREYLAHLRAITPMIGLLLLQEVGHGLLSTLIRRIFRRGHQSRGRLLRARMTLRMQARWIIGRIGVHRGAAVGKVRLASGKVVWVISAHGLHIKTSGKAAQEAYYTALRKRLDRITARGQFWVIGADFNTEIEHLAKRLGGVADGEGIVGVIYSHGLAALHGDADDWGKRHGITDHPSWTCEIVDEAYADAA